MEGAEETVTFTNGVNVDETEKRRSRSTVPDIAIVIGATAPVTCIESAIFSVSSPFAPFLRL